MFVMNVFITTKDFLYLKCRHGVLPKPKNGKCTVKLDCIAQETIESSSSVTQLADLSQPTQRKDVNNCAESKIIPATSSEPAPKTSTDRLIEIRADNRRGSERWVSRTNIFKSKIIKLRQSRKHQMRF